MKNIIIITLFAVFLNASFIKPTTAVTFAEDSYLEEQQFIKEHPNTKPFEVLGVSYFLNEDEKNIIITFRGTSNYENVKTDISFKDLGFNGHEDLRVHRGFYEIAINAKNQLKDILKKDKNITLIGHSLGGGVALLFGALLYDEGYKVHIYTFGMPASADENFKKYYKNLEHDRYANIFDPVPLMKKSVIQLIGSTISYIDELSDKELLKNISAYFEKDPYKYVHYGTLHSLDYEVALSPEQEDESFFKKQILKVLLFHSISTYKKNIYKSN